jgi:hypothetical protein
LFYEGFFQEGAKMKKNLVYLFIFMWMLINSYGCVPLVIGTAAGALGGYAVSKDTIQGETDKSYESLWNSALTVSRIRGSIKQENLKSGYIELWAGSSHVWINLVRLTRSTTRLRVSARRYHLPNMDLAQEIFVKIMEEAR